MDIPPDAFLKLHENEYAESIDYWSPEGVKRSVGSAGGSYIGLIDDHTVLKYPLREEDKLDRLDIEAQILEAAGSNLRIIEFKGKHPNGLLLGYACNGSVREYLQHASPTNQERLKWSKQAAEAVAYIHKKRILHCHLTADCLLLDENLDIKLCSLGGKLLTPDGRIVIEGDTWIFAKESMPRDDYDYSDCKTDIFGLGSTIHFVMFGRQPFPDLNSFVDEDAIKDRFRSKIFPPLSAEMAGHIIHRCWKGEYESAENVVQDFEELMVSRVGRKRCPKL